MEEPFKKSQNKITYTTYQRAFNYIIRVYKLKKLSEKLYGIS
jgi:hypothetical protein